MQCTYPRFTIHYPLFALLALLAGCSKPASKPEPQTVARPLEGMKLRLAVVEDKFLANAILRVRGEWNAQTGAELEVVEILEKEFTDANRLSADAAICSSHLLGTLTDRNLIAPVPQSVLRNPEWNGVFELLKLREATFGAKTMAVPFGSPVLCCYYRADLLEKLGRRPPETWAEYQELAVLLKGSEARGEGQDSFRGTIEPLAPGWAGVTLLARAASYAKHRDNYSTLFNIETMEPLVAGPAFVHALDELVAAAKSGPADPLHYDPSTARDAFWRGQCGMALSWPTAAVEYEEPADAAKTVSVGFCELPGSRRVYNLSTMAWDARNRDDDLHVPLLAVSGRLGVVDAKSANVDAAFQLLLWLSDSRMSPQISAASPSTTLFRKSNLQSPGRWVEHLIPPLAAVQYSDATEAALSHEQWLDALRIPGRAEYLAALDEAVAEAVRGKKSPLQALIEAEKKWRAITARLGLDRQRAAYRHSLGLE